MTPETDGAAVEVGKMRRGAAVRRRGARLQRQGEHRGPRRRSRLAAPLAGCTLLSPAARASLPYWQPDLRPILASIRSECKCLLTIYLCGVSIKDEFDDAVLDEAVFKLFKKEKVKQLKSKLNASVLRSLKVSKAVSTLGGCIDEHATADFRSRLESGFGKFLNDELLTGICGIYDAHCTKIPSNQKKFSEDLIFDLLKFFANAILDTTVKLVKKTKKADGWVVRIFTSNCKGSYPKKPTRPKTEKNTCGRILSFDLDSSKGATPVAELNGVSFRDANKFTPNLEKQKSPEVQFMKEINLVDKLKEMCNTSDKLYNESFVSHKDVNPCASTVLEDPGIADKKKVSPHMSFVTDDGVRNADKSDRFPITAQGRRLYNAVCTLASNSRYSKDVAVDIGGCILKYFSFGDSMAIGHRIVFMSNSDDYSYVGRCFNGAASVLPLPLCEMLFFPVLFGDHWFLFVVDLSHKMFLFLDSYCSKNDEYSVYTRKKLIANFRHAWGLFVGSKADFDGFLVAYPRVPKQTNIVDCGVFVIKFMELWKFDCNLLEEFSQKDIPNIRIQIVNDLLMSDHNKANIDVVRNYYG
ncbi:hypothetical protein U9M48_032060 [Paspalum notatum var. saurae]|uniref:Ubiquitin-like protease family profile domain-containing protein n=1 Tax=Paspalum notatum var. saurae TaxID=547442 RepID=A0AAQ3X5D2_PASNO